MHRGNQKALFDGLMMATDFDSMSIDELWALHEELATRLAARLSAEKAMLEERLKQLNPTGPGERQAPNVVSAERRPYPVVVPKYRNPDDSSETWSGRGKQPRWLVALVKAGKQIDDFRISPARNGSKVSP
jgi:DNA-binding protein H-NS